MGVFGTEYGNGNENATATANGNANANAMADNQNERKNVAAMRTIFFFFLCNFQSSGCHKEGMYPHGHRQAALDPLSFSFVWHYGALTVA